jgi:peptide/nickel transport system substrate-binding protein
VAACAKVATQDAAGRHSYTQAGVFRFGENADPKNLNVALDGSTVTNDLGYFIYSYAVRYNSKAEPVPDALIEVPTIANGDVSKDGLTLIYKLRHNITFQDGVPMTCKDIVFSWHYVMDPHTNVSATDGFTSIKNIVCSNTYDAVLHMKTAYAPFLQTIFGPNGNMPILPEHLLAKYMDGKGGQNTAPYNSMPIGSGPFKVIEWNRGTVVRMAAYPGYFLGRPKLNEVDYYIEPDENTLETQVQTHALDMLARGTAINWPRYEALGDDPKNGLKAVQVNSFIYSHVDFNLRSPIFSDVNVRRALAYATNTSDIRAKIEHGASYASDSPEHPLFSWGYTKDTVHYPFDPARARAMLDADGWRVGSDGIRVKNGTRFEFNMSTQSESTSGKATEALLQRQWHDVGVQADIKNYPTSQFFANGTEGVLAGGHFDVALYAWVGAADPDLNPLYSADNFSPRGQNYMHWDNPRATAAQKDALQTVDQARRKADYVIFQQELAKDVPTIIYSFRKEPYVYSTDLQGFDPSPVISAFWNPWEYSI